MPDRYSIKEVRECIDEIGRSDSDKYSCIDLTSGFWQMELEDESRQYTAFSVPGKASRLCTVSARCSLALSLMRSK
jgi:hypothetical protein